MKALPLTTDRHLVVRFALILAALATIALAGTAASASASTTVVTVGNPAKTIPVAQWISESTFPTPDVLVRVHYEDCPGGGDEPGGGPVACAGSLNNGAYDITITDRMFEWPTDFQQVSVLHELGHVVDAAYFGEQTKRDFAHRLGYPDDRAWFGDMPIGSDAEPSRIEPAEWFAETYSLCSSPNRSPDLAVYGFDLTYRQVLPLCQQISLQMTGKSIEVPPAPTFPVLCSPRCQVKLGANDHFSADEQLVPGTVSAVVKYGKKAAMLDRGCKGKVKFGGDPVFLNFCSGRLKVTTISYKKFRVFWWGQTAPPPAEPAPLPLLEDPHTTATVDGGGVGPFPLTQWVAQAKVATPNIPVKVVYGNCSYADAPACTSNFSSVNNFIWLSTKFLGDPGRDAEFYRALFYRSIGSFITRYYLGPQTQQQFKLLLGISPSTSWGAYDSSIPPSTSTPARLFAEAYATCAWGGDRPAGSVSYGFDRSYSSLKPICDRIGQLIDGQAIVAAPIVPPKTPNPACGSFCSTRLKPKKVWSTTLASPAAFTAVKVGKRLAALSSGCSGTVRIGRAAVRLNYCGSTLRAKSIGRGKPVVRYWNQPS